jgi:hypothetical protein
MAGREAVTLLDQLVAAARDSDPAETQEWLDALQAAVREGGAERGLFLLERLEEQAQQLGIVPHVQPFSAYRNTIPVEQQGLYPGDLGIEERLTAIMRWNALAMVVRANQAYGELGGHIASSGSTTSSAATGPPTRRRAMPTWSTSSRIRRLACTRAPSSRAGWTSSSWPTTGRS